MGGCWGGGGGERWTMSERTPASSQEQADWTLGLSEPDGGPSHSPRSTRTPRRSSPNGGRESRTSETSPVLTRTYGTKTRDRGPLALSGPAASPARTSASPGSDGEWSKAPAPTSPTPSSGLWDSIDLGSSSSRTFRDFSPVMAGETWRRSSVRWSNSGMAWDTGSLTLATSECRSADGECSSSESRLADVLEPSAPQRFYLSARAAAGILRRASKRGRELPADLDAALRTLSAPAIRAAEGTTQTASPTQSVRRLTPTECERLMGWPDGHTIVTGWQTRSASAAERREPRTVTTTPRGSQKRSTAAATPEVSEPNPAPTSPSAVSPLRQTASRSASTPTATDAAGMAS